MPNELAVNMVSLGMNLISRPLIIFFIFLYSTSLSSEEKMYMPNMNMQNYIKKLSDPYSFKNIEREFFKSQSSENMSTLMIEDFINSKKNAVMIDCYNYEQQALFTNTNHSTFELMSYQKSSFDKGRIWNCMSAAMEASWDSIKATVIGTMDCVTSPLECKEALMNAFKNAFNFVTNIRAELTKFAKTLSELTPQEVEQILCQTLGIITGEVVLVIATAGAGAAKLTLLIARLTSKIKILSSLSRAAAGSVALAKLYALPNKTLEKIHDLIKFGHAKYIAGLFQKCDLPENEEKFTEHKNVAMKKNKSKCKSKDISREVEEKHRKARAERDAKLAEYGIRREGARVMHPNLCTDFMRKNRLIPLGKRKAAGVNRVRYMDQNCDVYEWDYETGKFEYYKANNQVTSFEHQGERSPLDGVPSSKDKVDSKRNHTYTENDHGMKTKDLCKKHKNEKIDEAFLRKNLSSPGDFAYCPKG